MKISFIIPIVILLVLLPVATVAGCSAPAPVKGGPNLPLRQKERPRRSFPESRLSKGLRM